MEREREREREYIRELRKTKLFKNVVIKLTGFRIRKADLII